MSDKKSDKTYQKVSVMGWIGTLILSAVPVLNIIMWIIWICIAKRPSRRTYAGACLILTVLCAALVAAAVTLYGAQMLEWARQIDPELFTRGIQ